MIHQFCEFSAVIQLAATFNLGCIALSGKNSFARSLANYFFKVQYSIDKELADMKQLISTDLESMQKMAPLNIEGHNYELEINNLKERFEFLKKDTEEELSIINTEISQKYTPQYLDSMCILLGIYSVYELIFSFFIKINIDSFILAFFTLNTITCFWIIVYSCCEISVFLKMFCGVEKIDMFSIKDSKTAATFSAISLILALLFPVINKYLIPLIPYSSQIANIHFYIGLLLPFIGFILYWMYIQVLSQKAKQFIAKRLKPKKQDFNTLHRRKNEIDIILTEFNNMSIKIETTKK